MVDHSLRDGDFLVYLQPKVGLKNNRVEGAEALVRWKHPEKGMLSPAMFIPLAEKYRLISRLDLFVFEEVCRILARWKRENKDLMTISVNLSRQNLDNPTFLRDYQTICAQYDVAPSLIEFELTETIMFENPQGIKSIIDDIHAYGFRCSLDDFGTGFSALGLLNDLDVDVIKLDRSFFIGKNNSRRGRHVVESILKLAAQLHIHTVAEGIDSLEQVQYLREAACDMIQGFYFYKPMPVEEFDRQVFENKMKIRLKTERYKTEMVARCVHVSKRGKEWKYGIQILEMEDADKDAYFQILYDREHSLAKVMKLSASMFDDIFLNVQRRSVQNESSKRELPRIDLNMVLETTDGQAVEVTDTNYEYVMVRNSETDLPERFELKFPKSEFTMHCVRDTHRKGLYYVENWKELVFNDAFDGLFAQEETEAEKSAVAAKV